MHKCKHCGGEIVALCSADISLGIDKYGNINEDDVKGVTDSWLQTYACTNCDKNSKNIQDIADWVEEEK